MLYRASFFKAAPPELHSRDGDGSNYSFMHDVCDPSTILPSLRRILLSESASPYHIIAVGQSSAPKAGRQGR